MPNQQNISQPKTSPKLMFALGLVSAVAIISLIGFVSLLVKGGIFKKNKIQECIDSGKYASKVQEQYNDAVATGAQGTPYNVIIGPNDQKEILAGAYPIEAFKQIIDKFLAGESIATTDEDSEEEPKEINLKEVTAQDHIRGSLTAPIKIVEYSDLLCPFCQKHHSTMKQLLADYGNKIIWVYRHFPLASLHPTSPKMAEAVECAAEMGGDDAFWKLADRISEDSAINLSNVAQTAKEMGLEKKKK